MNTIGGKITTNYGFEITILHKLRKFSDGISIFDGKINWDRYKADHSPRVVIAISLNQKDKRNYNGHRQKAYE